MSDTELTNDQVQEILKEAENSCPKEYFNTLRPGECDLLCSSGRCNADCCGCVDFLESDFHKLKKFIPDNTVYYPHLFQSEDGSICVKPITKNFKCVFLSKENSCLIYDSTARPAYCKRFGEDKVQPLFACIHINPEMKAEIEEFARLYLANQTQDGNILAKTILEQSIESSPNS